MVITLVSHTRGPRFEPGLRHLHFYFIIASLPFLLGVSQGQSINDTQCHNLISISARSLPDSQYQQHSPRFLTFSHLDVHQLVKQCRFSHTHFQTIVLGHQFSHLRPIFSYLSHHHSNLLNLSLFQISHLGLAAHSKGCLSHKLV